jgi:hypothetical protein
MWLLIPIIVVIVVLLGVGSLTSAVFGVLGGNWPWLLIAVGVWMFWHQDGRHRHRRRGNGWQPRTIVVNPSQAPAKRSDKKAESKPAESKPATITPLRKPELPIDMQVKVEQIRRKVDVLLGFADRFPPFSKDLYVVQQTATEYLPRTIEAYLALLPEAAERPLGTTGRTPHQELQAQLDLLDAKLDEIAQDLERQDVDRLLANRHFLETRFGKQPPPAEKASA